MTSSRTAQKLPGIESNAKFPHIQDFPKALRTWWRLLGGGGWGAENGVLKILENTCEGVNFLVKMAAISLQACNFTKKNFLTHIFQGF